MSGAKVTDNDKVCCESIAKSISEIIRFSLNEEFRRKSCELFGVFSTKDLETEISRRLLSILENTNTKSKKRRKNLSKEKNKENVEERNGVPYETAGDESCNTSSDCNSQTLSKSTFQNNWLQISSQKYREAVKRKKLQFYSQPQNALHSQPFELSSSSVSCSNSQPTSEASSSSQLNGISDSLGDEATFRKKRFKESFVHNTGKYLKKNLRHRHTDF